LGVCFTYLLGSLLYGRTAGLCACLFLFFNGIYFAQSAMFLPDVPVAAVGVTTVYFVQRGRYRSYLAAALALVLLKETAMAIVFAVVVYVFVRECHRSIKDALKTAARYAVPLLFIGSYYTYKRIVTGTFFVDYDYRFEALHLDVSTATTQFWLVTRWLFVR